MGRALVVGLFLALPALAGLAISPASGRAEQSTHHINSRRPGNAGHTGYDPRKKIRRLQQGIKIQKIRIVRSRKKAHSLLAELEKIDRRLQTRQQKLADLKKKLARREQMIHDEQVDINRVIAEKEHFKTHVQKRLTAYYQSGSISILDEFFAAHSLPDLLNFEEYYHLMLQSDQNIIAAWQAKLTELNQAKDELIRGKNHLARLIEQITEEKKQLTTTRREKSALMTRVATEKKLYQQALTEIEAAAAGLSSTLEELGGKPSPPAPQATDHTVQEFNGTDFAAQKGRLDPPVPGEVITNYGGGRLGLFGIDIKAEPGAAVKAVYDGRVVYADYLRGYGNLLIIDHGRQYFSVIARLAGLLKQKGNVVTTGELIGVMGENKALLGEGLHFEIRHGAEPQNPLQWLNNAKLKGVRSEK